MLPFLDLVCEGCSQRGSAPRTSPVHPRSIHSLRWKITGMRIRIRSDPLIYGPPDPDPLLFSLDPDPTCNNVLFLIIFIMNKV